MGIYIIIFYIIGVRAGARAGYVIPGRDGNGGWRFEEILPPSPSSSPSPSAPKSRVFGENGILRFVTHSRAMNFLASAYESYGRGGSFLFRLIRRKSQMYICFLSTNNKYEL